MKLPADATISALEEGKRGLRALAERKGRYRYCANAQFGTVISVPILLGAGYRVQKLITLGVGVYPVASSGAPRSAGS
jgi:hypothetical protein